MNFDVLGPFEIARYGEEGLITNASRTTLVDTLEGEVSGLSEARGCYVFAVRAGRGYTPCQVGQACKRPIAKEALSAGNRTKFNEVLRALGRGTPILFVIPLLTASGEIRNTAISDGGLDEVDFLERWLIASALAKNPDLIDSPRTRSMRHVRVPGIFNSRTGRPTQASGELRRTLGL